MLKKLTPNRESHMSVTDRESALYFSYLEVLNFYLANIHGGLQLEDFDEKSTYCWWQIPYSADIF